MLLSNLSFLNICRARSADHWHLECVRHVMSSAYSPSLSSWRLTQSRAGVLVKSCSHTCICGCYNDFLNVTQSKTVKTCLSFNCIVAFLCWLRLQRTNNELQTNIWAPLSIICCRKSFFDSTFLTVWTSKCSDWRRSYIAWQIWWCSLALNNAILFDNTYV